MIAFVDTSAFLAILDRDDRNHARAGRKWQELLEGDVALVCTSYVLLETTALLQARFGLQALRVFQEDLSPLLTIEWVEAELHRAGMTAVLISGRRGLSLTDCISFEVMRRRGIRKAFAFDRHFREQGFEDVG
jgi:predicted nucleic acid-binding protein